MKNPPADLAARLLEVGEQVLDPESTLRLEDVARLVGASRATMYYYFSGRDDLLTFLLTEHTRRGAAALAAAVDPAEPADVRLTAAVSALVDYLSRHPGTCAGLLAVFGGAGRIGEVLQETERRIAGPLRELIGSGPDAADATNAVLGALLLGVLGRVTAGADPTDVEFRRRLTEQAVRGVLGHG